MTGEVFLEATTVAFVLGGVALLAAATTFFLEVRDLPGRRAVVVFFLCLAAIWLLACGVLAFVAPTI